MIQVKFILGVDLPDLNETLNSFLQTVNSDDVNINYDHIDDLLIIVEYEKDEPYKRSICSECQNWQENSPSSLVGLCQAKGHRKRFDCKACSAYVDIRK